MSILEDIVNDKRVELAGQMAAVAVEAVKNRAAHSPETRSLADALRAPGVSVIAEFKRRSPSAGAINEAADPAAMARAYEAAGAAAISVVTERNHFGGHLDDLIRARRATRLPCLRKDFLFDDYQIFESRAVGADAVLLIARVLGRDGLQRMLAAVADAGLEALVEVHSESELTDALEVGAQIVGINNRDLETFDVDLSVVEQLRPMVPEGVLVVSESGCRARQDVVRLRAAGVDAVLVGGALMAAGDIADRMNELFGRE